MYTQIKFQPEDPYVSRVRHNSTVREINTSDKHFEKWMKHDRLAINILKHESSMTNLYNAMTNDTAAAAR